MLTGHPHWHVVWVTRLAWPPTDERGDWQALADLYSRLSAAGLSVEMSERLPERWKCYPARDGTVNLSAAARSFLAADLLALATSDRVAGGTIVRAWAIGLQSVQLVVSCPPASMNQRIGRFKSRSATLLGFRTELGAGGDATWGKGIWWARIDHESAVETVERFVRNSSVDG